MIHGYLSKIKSLQSKIDSALKESGFEKLANLSTELETSVKDLISEANNKDGITQNEEGQIRSSKAKQG